MAEIENKEFDNPQQREGDDIASKPNGVQNSSPAVVSPGSTSETSVGGDNAASSGTPPKDSTGGATSDTVGIDRKINTLQDVIDRLGPMETEEQRRKRERREKSAKIISAVGDGVSALANLFFTTKGAPNMHTHEASQLTALQGAIEKARKEREAKRDEFLRYSLALGDAENDRAKTVRELAAQQEALKMAREKVEREAEAHGWEALLQPDKLREQKGKADRAGFEAQSAGAKAGKAGELAQAEVDAKVAQADSYRASAQNSLASAVEHERSDKYVAYDEQGREHTFRKRENAEYFARQHGTWHEEEYEETTDMHTKSDIEGESERTTTTRKKRGYSKKPFNVGKYKRGGSSDRKPPLN